MDMQIVDNEEVVEPITLTEAKNYLQIDADYAGDDTDVELALASARKRLEAYLNIGMVQRKVTVYWGGNPIELPLSPTSDIISLKKGGDAVSTDDYTVIDLPAKRIAINSMCHLQGNWFYSILGGYVEFTPEFNNNNHDVYVCEYNTGYETLPKDLKLAILAETSYLFKLRGAPVTDLISPNAYVLAQSYSRNLIL